MNGVPRWRMVAAILVLAALAFFAAIFTPIYLRNLRLQSYVSALPKLVESHGKPGAAPSDDTFRKLVLDKARQLELPVTEDDVHIFRSRDGAHVQRIDVRYIVRIDLPGYTVDLHFYPGAGSR